MHCGGVCSWDEDQFFKSEAKVLLQKVVDCSLQVGCGGGGLSPQVEELKYRRWLQTILARKGLHLKVEL